MAQEGWTVEFYTDRNGRSPVERFLREIRRGPGRKHETRILRQVEALRRDGLGASGDLIAKMKTGGKVSIWELRATFQKNPYRVLFYNPGGRTLVLLHAFLKKTNAVPVAEVQRAEAAALDDQERRR